MFTKQWFAQFISPNIVAGFASRVWPYLFTLMLLAFIIGLVWGLFYAPSDYQQGDAFRIIYIHVPSAFLSLTIYSVMAFCALLCVVWQIKLADVVIATSAPIGACFTLLALITGSIWGKPMWGTWWIWDARLTSELILLLIYFAVMALRQALPNSAQSQQIIALFILVGFLDIPLIHYSVNWWNTLHQGATLSKFAKPSIAPIMLYPLLAMIAAFFCFYAQQLFVRARIEVLRREYRSQWAREIVLASHN